MPLSGKVILVTGGTGSSGRKFAEVVLKEHDIRAIPARGVAAAWRSGFQTEGS